MVFNPMSSNTHFVSHARHMLATCPMRLAVACAAVAMCFPALGYGEDAGHVSDLPFTVMTFNTGTGAPLTREPEENLGYGPEQARISDTYYGNGLAWKAAVDVVRDFVQEISPDIVAFQEMFYCGDCADIPEDARAGFVCEDWKPGSPSVARLVLGDDYQIATHTGHNDKYLAVHKRFGRMRGCDTDFCPEGLDGFRIEDCGGGSRLGRAVIERKNGETLTVITYHGTSGVWKHDKKCRVKQIEQIFIDFGDGAPGVNGRAHLILGDFNTDPARMRFLDRSAQRWNDFVGDGKPFHFLTAVASCAPRSYAYGLVNIDHIVSDVFHGDVLYPSKPDAKPPIFQFQMFDHTPVVVRIETQERRD